MIICTQGTNWLLYPCKRWTGAHTKKGYGHRGGRRPDGERYVHRSALVEKLGRPIQPGMDALHYCDVRDCIEPGHLYEGTDSNNKYDMHRKGRAVGKQRGVLSNLKQYQNKEISCVS